MKKLLFVFILFFVMIQTGFSQLNGQQYFDGNDSTYIPPCTWAPGSIFIYKDTTSGNVWQVGKPQKIIFDSAATLPNGIVTDTINPYPINNTSSFYFDVPTCWNSHAILGIQWMQKLDMDQGTDGGLVEFSFDYGATWLNAFNNPYVWNFFGYDPSNKDTLSSGEYAFSGTDSTWKDVWLCYQMDFVAGSTDSVKVRFTLKSDSVNNNREGWLIDNLNVHYTMAHPVKETASKSYFNVFPNPAKDKLNIELQSVNGFHIIEEMEFLTADGKRLLHWTRIPTRFWFDTSKYASGLYYLKVRSNIKSETIPITIQH